MKVSGKLLLAGALLVLGASSVGCGAGNGSVYVGVAVPGPYWGYPYHGPYTGPWGGYPSPYYWDDLEEEDSVELTQTSIEAAPSSLVKQ